MLILLAFFTYFPNAMEAAQPKALPTVLVQFHPVVKNPNLLKNIAKQMDYPQEIRVHFKSLKKKSYQISCCGKIITYYANFLQHYQEKHMAEYFTCAHCPGLFFVSKHQHNQKKDRERCRIRKFPPTLQYTAESHKHKISFIIN